MKLHADRAEGVNVINAHSPHAVWVNGIEHGRSVLVPLRGEPQPWNVSRLDDLTEAHFAQIIALEPEVVLLGTGPSLRFAPAVLMRSLMAARIGVETMDTAAACRTYNILVGEGRKAVAALLVQP